MNEESKSYIAGEFCPLCGSTGEIWGEKDGSALRKCCGSLLSWPWKSVSDYENQYTTMEYHRDACLDLGLPPQTDRFDEHHKAACCRIRGISNLLEWKTLKILDIGASNGAFVKAAKYDLPAKYVVGLEPNEMMCSWAAERYDVPMLCGSWKDMTGYWDLSMATDIIEHLTEPEAFLRKVRAHSFYLYLETPDWDNSRDILWKHIKPKEHICLFSEESLSRLAEKTGWRVDTVNRPIEGKLSILLI